MNVIHVLNTSLGSSLAGAILGYLLTKLPTKRKKHEEVRVERLIREIGTRSDADPVFPWRAIHNPTRRLNSSKASYSDDAIIGGIFMALVATATLVWIMASGWQWISLAFPAATGLLSLVAVAMNVRYPFIRGKLLELSTVIASGILSIVILRWIAVTPKGLLNLNEIARATAGLGISDSIAMTANLLQINGLEIYAIRGIGFVLALSVFWASLMRSFGGFIAPSQSSTSMGAFWAKRAGNLTKRQPFEVDNLLAALLLLAIAVASSLPFSAAWLWRHLG